MSECSLEITTQRDLLPRNFRLEAVERQVGLKWEQYLNFSNFNCTLVASLKFPKLVQQQSWNKDHKVWFQQTRLVEVLLVGKLVKLFVGWNPATRCRLHFRVRPSVQNYKRMSILSSTIVLWFLPAFKTVLNSGNLSRSVAQSTQGHSHGPNFGNWSRHHPERTGNFLPFW